MRALTIAVVLLATTTARAEGERVTAVTLGLVFGIHSLPESMGTGSEPVPAVARVAEGFGGPRLMLGFERAPLAYPATRGYRTDTQLVPELLLGGYVIDRSDADGAEVMVGAGLRAEVRIAQREMGLMRVSARVALYAAARAMVIGENRDPMGELVLGYYMLLGRGRFGFEFGGMARDEDSKAEAQKGFVCQLYLGASL